MLPAQTRHCHPACGKGDLNRNIEPQRRIRADVRAIRRPIGRDALAARPGRDGNRGIGTRRDLELKTATDEIIGAIDVGRMPIGRYQSNRSATAGAVVVGIIGAQTSH
jgi:hypothetical protein